MASQNAIDTMGANGASDVLASQIEAFIQQCLANGTIDQAQANQLLALANQGHFLASAEKCLEDAMFQGKSQVVFNGVTYETWKLASDLAINPTSTTEWSMTDVPAAPILSPFIQQYQAAYRSIACPTKLSVLETLSVGQLIP